MKLPVDLKDAVRYSVDGDSNENPPLQVHVTGTSINLKPFAVSVIDFKR